MSKRVSSEMNAIETCSPDANLSTEGDSYQTIDLTRTIDEAIDCIAGTGHVLSSVVARLCTLRERLASQRFQLAILGQFKRGKSTFINALLEAPLLPTGVVPLTAFPTFIRRGAQPGISDSHPSRDVPNDIAIVSAAELSQLTTVVSKTTQRRNACSVNEPLAKQIPEYSNSLGCGCSREIAGDRVTPECRRGRGVVIAGIATGAHPG